ncbi:DUF7547 family protein [Halobellus rufus]|uniref:DUF7547 family protein n=1 Tax=Halobellus rufus TaxID=1448860 RepID=UPI0006784A93|nr:hypothetical protein [Halobellus rufus]
MSARDSDEDLQTLVEELEATLTALRSELDDRDGAPDTLGTTDRPDAERGDLERRSRRRVSRERSRPPRPPSVSELLRFTERYTLPTLISTLEATIQSLELLRGALRLADPDRSAFDGSDRTGRSSTARLGDGVAGVGRGAVSGVERALSELQTALSESDLPEDDDSRDLLEDARRLSEEVSDRLAEASGERDADRYGYRRTDRESASTRERSGSEASTAGVEISVRDARDEDATSEEAAAGEPDDATEDDGESGDAPSVDVEAELASIKDEVDGRSGADAEGDASDTSAADESPPSNDGASDPPAEDEDGS